MPLYIDHTSGVNYLKAGEIVQSIKRLPQTHESPSSHSQQAYKSVETCTHNSNSDGKLSDKGKWVPGSEAS